MEAVVSLSVSRRVWITAPELVKAAVMAHSAPTVVDVEPDPISAGTSR